MGFKGEICRRENAFSRFYRNGELDRMSKAEVEEAKDMPAGRELPSTVIPGVYGVYYENASMKPPIPSTTIGPLWSKLERLVSVPPISKERMEGLVSGFEEYVKEMYLRLGEMFEEAREEETQSR